MKISPGCEVRLSPVVPGLVKKGRLMTVGDEGAKLLVELPLDGRPVWTEEILYQIRLLGLAPVVAHPERYSWLDDGGKWVKKIKDLGVLVQGNISSLAGKYGPRVKKRINAFLKDGLVDFWGSDAHSVKGYEILKGFVEQK